MSEEIKFTAPVWSARKVSKAAERGKKAVLESTMKVRLGFSPSGKLSRVHIELRGDLARIPSLKNSRHPKFPGIDGVVRAKLKALDVLFAQEIAGYATKHSNISFGDQKVFLAVSFARQIRSFDEDNATTTLKDWLEPKFKVVGGKARKNRGWGIGLVNNDSQIIAAGAKSSDIRFDESLTEILIVPFENAEHSLCEFFCKVFLGVGL